MFPRDEDNAFFITAHLEPCFRVCVTAEEVAKWPDAKRLPECKAERRGNRRPA